MATTRAAARVFNGSEIRRSIADAIEALDEGTEIVEFHAGENMQIVCVRPCIVSGTVIGFNTDAWTGDKWETIQWD
jgi:hypothetical protein